MLLSLMDDPNRIAVQGKVVWITPEGVQGNRTQGIGVQFTQDDTGGAARAIIEKSSASLSRRRVRRTPCKLSSRRRDSAGSFCKKSQLCSSIPIAISIFRSLRARFPRCSMRWQRRR
jgi:hypothetical protein